MGEESGSSSPIYLGTGFPGGGIIWLEPLLFRIGKKWRAKLDRVCEFSFRTINLEHANWLPISCSSNVYVPLRFLLETVYPIISLHRVR